MALNHQNIRKIPQRISKIKPFIDQFNWNETDFPSHSRDWQKFERHNKALALNTFVPYNTKK